MHTDETTNIREKNKWNWSNKTNKMRQKKKLQHTCCQLEKTKQKNKKQHKTKTKNHTFILPQT